MPKVTIYTQAYNARPYLKQCIESVLNQTYTDFEWILIDHGSTDNTRAVIESYAERDKRIVPIYLDVNNLFSMLFFDSLKQKATGKYLTWLDADDWWDLDYLEKLVPFAEGNNLDLAMTGAVRYFQKEGVSRVFRQCAKPLLMTVDGFAQNFQKIGPFGGAMWANLRPLDKAMSLETDPRVLEILEKRLNWRSDTLHMLAYIDGCQRIGINEYAPYHYRRYTGSVSEQYSDSYFESITCCYYRLQDFLSRHGALDEDALESLKERHLIEMRTTLTVLYNSDFNPFPYIKDDKDAMKLVHSLIKNTTPKNASNNDPFWEKSEIALDTALILYLLHEAPPEEQNFEMVMYMIENGGAREDDDDFQSPLDMLFEALEEEEPDHIAVREYKIFKQAAGKTAKSILIQAAVRLSAFILPQIIGITNRDDMELGLMGDRKQAVFAIIPDNDGTFNYLVGMLYTCAFQALYYQADKVHQGALPVPVRLMMDEFCNVSLPDDFGKLQATMRSRNIMSTIVLQNISALKALFKDDWEGLLGNADTMIYLGGNEQSTHKYISEMLGKETINTRNQSITKGSHGSSSISHQQTGRELLTPDEVRAMDNAYAIVFIRGERPVIDKKYDILKHPNIKLTEDGGAAPYIHHPGLTFAQEDLSLPFEGLDNIIIIDEEEPSNEKDR